MRETCLIQIRSLRRRARTHAVCIPRNWVYNHRTRIWKPSQERANEHTEILVQAIRSAFTGSTNACRYLGHADDAHFVPGAGLVSQGHGWGRVNDIGRLCLRHISDCIPGRTLTALGRSAHLAMDHGRRPGHPAPGRTGVVQSRGGSLDQHGGNGAVPALPADLRGPFARPRRGFHRPALRFWPASGPHA